MIPDEIRGALASIYHKYPGEPGLRELAGRGLVPPRVVLGRGPVPPRAILLGEAPGATEAREGQPFVGPSGQLMTRQMGVVGLDPEDFWITNAVKIRPPRNRTPDDEELNASRPYLLKELALIGAGMHGEPVRLIVALGATAATILQDRRVSISRIAGRFGDLVFADSGSWKVFWSYHPAAALRSNAIRKEFCDGLAAVKLYLDGER